MRKLAVCIRKEWLELVRTKKILFYILFPIGALFLTVSAILRLDMVMQQYGSAGMGFPSYRNLEGMLSLYASMMLSYYLIVTMLLQMGSSSREMARKQWLFPQDAGISRANIVLAKAVVLPLVATLPALIGTYVAVILGGLWFGNGTGLPGSVVLRTGICTTVAVLEFSVITVALSALTGKTWLTGLISVGGYLIGDAVLSVWTGAYYTPFAFEILALSGASAEVTALQWVCASVSTFALIFVLVIAAMQRPERFSGRRGRR